MALALQNIAAAEPAGKLRCYDLFTQIGTVAVREFFDAAARVEKQIFYDSLVWRDPTDCTPDKLRVQAVRTYVRDADGREVLETQYDREGRLGYRWVIAYHGRGRDSYTRTSLGPSGELRSRLRYRDDHHVELVFDENRRVAAARGPLPDDVEYSLGWGPVVDGWSCGLGLPATRVAGGGGRIVLHLRNHTDKEDSAWLTRAFETDLRDEAGRLVPFTADYLAQEQELAADGRSGVSVESGGAAFVYSVDLNLRYGKLPPGHYTLAVRHPHPKTAATLVSNTLAFELPLR